MFNLMKMGLALQAASIGKHPPRDYSVRVTAPDFATAIKVSGAVDEQEAIDEVHAIVSVAFPRLFDAQYKVL